MHIHCESKKGPLYFCPYLKQILTDFQNFFNIVDFKVPGTIHGRVYQTKVRDVDDLKRRLIEVLDSLEQSVIDNAIDKCRSRLNSCSCPCKMRTF